MVVLGFLAAVTLIRRLSRDILPDSQIITNATLYALIAGVVGSRLFYVVHYLDQFRDDPFSVFAIWHGGLEVLGGGILAIAVIFFYLSYRKLPVRRCLDILAIGMMLALVFGRIGCFLNGDCFGKPTDLPWGVRFPYESFVYRSQISPNLERNRAEPQLILPDEFFEYADGAGLRYAGPKPYQHLTPLQKEMVDNGPYRCLPVHPVQSYSSANAGFLCFVLYLFWRRSKRGVASAGASNLFTKPGSTFALMFIVYGIARFFIEFIRDDNPFEYGWWAIYKGGTISQNISIYMVLFGFALMLVFQFMKPDRTEIPRNTGQDNTPEEDSPQACSSR
jgi:phosphatidylglycerol:prolipoprotein diacylglycerol transferase